MQSGMRGSFCAIRQWKALFCDGHHITNAVPARGPNRTTADELGLSIPAQLYIFADEMTE